MPEPTSAPRGTTAHSIEMFGEPGADHYLTPVTLGTFGPLCWWQVQGTDTTSGAPAWCTFQVADSVEAARSQLADLRDDPEHARYDTWEIVRMESLVRTSLEPLEPAPPEETSAAPDTAASEETDISTIPPCPDCRHPAISHYPDGCGVDVRAIGTQCECRRRFADLAATPAAGEEQASA